MKDSRIDLTAAVVVVAISWFAAANMGQYGRENSTKPISFQLELEVTVMPTSSKKVNPPHKIPDSTPIPQPVDEDLARRIATRKQ